MNEFYPVSPDQSTQLQSQLLRKAAVSSAPLLLTLLFVGVLDLIFQVVTQIQETSLTFIPKLIDTLVVFATAGPWVLARLMACSTALINRIPHKLLEAD
jgi:flagellar biosynthetic protein FliQ